MPVKVTSPPLDDDDDDDIPEDGEAAPGTSEIEFASCRLNGNRGRDRDRE